MRSWRREMSWVVLFTMLVWAGGCTTAEVNVGLLHLEITSDPPEGQVTLSKLRFLFTQETSSGQARFPDSPDGLTLRVSDDFDPVSGPVMVALQYLGAPFGDEPEVLMQVVGLGEADETTTGVALTVHERIVALTDKVVIRVHLTAVPLACDEDQDGFLDCEQPGCCVGAGAELSDCEPTDPGANPWSDEEPCDQCNDGIDQDCSGGDAICVDGDLDGIPDCKEVAESCGLDDPLRGPGLPEMCDGIDNDCDQETDESFFAEGGLAPGEPCGLGVCASLPDGTPGVVQCTDDQQGAVCSTAGQRQDEETCGNGLDDDCDGTPDEGCQITDLDGDGYSVNQVGGSEVDCNDYDSGIHPGVQDEPCCTVNLQAPQTLEEQEQAFRCDRNCDGEVIWCDPNDLDGDGFTGDLDCDETDPLTYEGAPEKCGDGIDQNCFGGDESCDGFGDADGDGWKWPTDCDDANPTIAPGVAEVCNNIDDNCDGYTDEGNASGVDIDTGIPCGEDEGECAYGVNVCVGSYSNVPGEYVPGQVACIGDIPPIAESCDGLDNDCDGAPDNGFAWEGTPVCDPGGVCGFTQCDGTGACGVGYVVCTKEQTSAICSTMVPPDQSGSGVETEECNGVDDDCDGDVDEDITEVYAVCYDQDTQENDCKSPCKVVGVCAGDGNPTTSKIEATCKVNPQPAPEEPGALEPAECWGWGWVCDYSGVDDYQDLSGFQCPPHPLPDGYQKSDALEAHCDELDNDCDGLTDEEFIFTPSCDGDDLDKCHNGITRCEDTTDDPTDTWCDETQAQTQPELCDYEDNDCDDDVDEGFDTLGQVCGIGVCSFGTKECTSAGVQNDDAPAGTKCDSMPPSAAGQSEPGTNLSTLWSSSDKCDGLDDDCDGLTDEDFSAKGSACDGNDLDQCFNGTWKCAESGSTLECTNETVENIVDVCNNIDDDCDGPIDEALEGIAFIGDAGCDTDGACGESGQTSAVCGLQSPGQWTCQYNSPNYQSDNEVGRCDGLDNDCDGSIDEDFTWQQLSIGAVCTGVGECGDGVVVCNELESGAMCSTMLPGHPDYQAAPADGCNGLDDNCNGQVDEALVGTQYASNCDQDGVCGLAGETIATCTGQGGVESWSCDYGAAGYQATNELGLCDDLDNDCDEQVDEDFKPGGAVSFDGGPYAQDAGLTLGQGCGTGACASGVVQCDGTSSLTCSTLGQTSVELCNEVDDDCDGQTDDPYVDGSITYGGDGNLADNGKDKGQACGWGQCVGGTVECKNGNSLACSTMPAGSNAQDTFEICDGQDNDCDGQTDEGFDWEGIPVCVGAVCGGGTCNGTGECGNGVVLCDTSTEAICSTMKPGHPHYDAPPKACNGKDDDCDGSVDEDWADELGTSCGDGECAGGTVECRADGQGIKCASMPALPGGQSEAGSFPQDEAEACDGTDDEDCDGAVDEDWAAELDLECEIAGQGCYWACTANKLGIECVRDNPGPDQTCDDVDDDCDGIIDQIFVASADGGLGIKAYTDPQNNEDERFKGQSCGTGPCVGVVVCDPANPATLICNGAAPALADNDCDNVDDDCDGQTDEQYVGDPITCGVGACVAAGVTVCQAGQVLDDCTPGAKLAETDGTCDGVDDDCDGSEDEDACDDGDPCTESDLCVGLACEGTSIDCADGLDCTDDSCAAGLCGNDVQVESCVVGAVCYADQDPAPDNVCVLCDATASQDEWTPVADGVPCQGGQTCVGGVCAASACDDGFWNGDETDQDCGGGCPDKCDVGSGCGDGDDCETGVCTGEVCQAATCTDLVTNGDETDTDCGGSCPDDGTGTGFCPDGAECAQDQDCESAICSGNKVCAVPSCTDEVTNGAETDTDCGGGSCPVCLEGKECLVDTDCLTGACEDGTPNKCSSTAELTCISWGVVDLIFDGYGCTGCHGGSGGLSLTSYTAVMTDPGNHGLAVVAGDADSSNLYLKLLANPPFKKRMPRNGPDYLTPEELLVVEAWINLGANNICN